MEAGRAAVTAAIAGLVASMGSGADVARGTCLKMKGTLKKPPARNFDAAPTSGI